MNAQQPGVAIGQASILDRAVASMPSPASAWRSEATTPEMIRMVKWFSRSHPPPDGGGASDSGSLPLPPCRIFRRHSASSHRQEIPATGLMYSVRRSLPHIRVIDLPVYSIRCHQIRGEPFMLRLFSSRISSSPRTRIIRPLPSKKRTSSRCPTHSWSSSPTRIMPRRLNSRTSSTRP